MSFLSDMFGGARSPLLEAVNYADMFTDVVRALKHRPEAIDEAVANARESLKKNDRILWYLRAWKVGFVEANAQRLPEPFVARVAADYARRTGMTEGEAKTVGWTVFNDPSLLTTLRHYLSLPVPQIQNHSFGNESPQRLLHLFRKAADAYHAEASDAFEDETATQIMRFPNGLAWYDLNRSACDREGQSMGHGGNAHRRGSGDTILSLRQISDHGPRRLHKPILTFVLDQHGLLGEMKGRYNEKPEHRYYNEIVSLLRSPIVHGIKGGGYKSENNFSIDDLDDATRDELLADKPELGGLYALYKHYGIEDDRVMTALEERLQSENIATPMLRPDGDGNMIIQVWRDLETFAESQEDGIVVALIELLHGDDSGLNPVEELDDATVAKIIDSLSERDYVRLMRALQVKAVSHRDPQYQHALMLAAQRLRHSGLYDLLLESANASLNLTGKRREIEERLATYIAVDWSFGDTHQFLAHDGEDGSVELKIRVEDLVSMATATEDHGDTYLHALHEVRERQWGKIDRHETSTKREEAGLSPVMNFDGKSKLDTDPVFAVMLSDSLLDVDSTGSTFMRKAGL